MCFSIFISRGSTVTQKETCVRSVGYLSVRAQANFTNKAAGANCIVLLDFTDPGWKMHLHSEIGIDDFQARPSPDKLVSNYPLKGLWTHRRGGFFHDGRFPTLLDAVEHHDNFVKLGFSEQEKGTWLSSSRPSEIK